MIKEFEIKKGILTSEKFVTNKVFKYIRIILFEKMYGVF